MSKVSTRSFAAKLFDNEHLAVIIGTLLVTVHIVDEQTRQESLAPPFIALLIFTAIYSLLPAMLRVAGLLAFGAIFFFAQFPGHIIPAIQKGPTGSDYTGMTPMFGAIIFVYTAMRLSKSRFERK